jgi:elongation factor G
MGFESGSIRNVALVGHGGTGKTSLLEHLLYAGGAIPKPEAVEGGKTTSDYSEEEIEHKISIHASLASFAYGDKKLNFIDSPGSGDFVGEVILALRACESAVVAVDAKTGVQIETIKSWRTLNARNKPRFIMITKMDDERADFKKALDDVHAKFGVHPVPLVIPMGQGASFKGVIDVLAGKAYPAPGFEGKEAAQAVPAEYAADVEQAMQLLSEAAADGDEELMDKYLEEGKLGIEETRKGIMEALQGNRAVPALCCSSLKGSGMQAFLDLVSQLAPSPLGTVEKLVKPDGAQVDFACSNEAPFSAFVFKTQIDQFNGRLSYLKVYSGSIAHDSEFFHSREGKKEKAFKLYTALGKKLVELPELVAGDIGIAAKVPSLHTNDTLCASEGFGSFIPLRLPTPVHALAISAASKKDEDKLSELLFKATEEDFTFSLSYNAETKESVIAGMGEQQINIILERVKRASKIEVSTRVPRVAYRETITKHAGAEFTHKKQTGGHGQYARVVIDIDPLERGKNYEFVNAIFGGAVSKGFIPGIEKGIHEAMMNGVLAGYPVVDVKTTLKDGKEHPVDSSELAFKLAARGAFKEAMKNAGPVLLEPVMNLTVFIENQYLGDVMSDLSGRRGKILGEASIGGGIEELKAQVPQAELLRYAIDLRSITSGTGSFEVEFDHYSPISGKTAEEVIKAAQAFRTEEAEE